MGRHNTPMPPISRRAESLGTENAFVVLAEVNALARQGKDIISFCIGQPDFPAPEHVQEAAIRAIRGGKHGYTPSAGIDELREAAARYLGAMRGNLPIRPEDVVVGAGAKPFIAYAILSTTDYGAGDEVIYPNPGFPIYESQIAANGAKAVPIHLHEKRGFSFDPDELARLLNKRTKLLILNYPHNPTGGCLTRAELERIAEVLKRHPQVWVYADEIYSRLAYVGEFFSIAQVPGMYERTIISDGASKTWAMTGWRIGFTSNPALAPIFPRWITNTDSCPSQISQWAAVERINGRLVLNQPAGHLDPGESLVAACRREVLEETAHRFEPRALVGIYRWHYAAKDVTFLRFCFAGDVSDADPARKLDKEIVRLHWLTAAELQAR